MVAGEGTDASVLAGIVVASSLALCVAGLAALSGTTFGITGATLVPLLLGAAAFLVMMLVVDPVLTPKHPPTRDEIHIWLSKTVLCRLPAIEVPMLAGLLIAFVGQERGMLLTGVLGTLVLASVWWPGEQFFNAMRRRLQPLSADRLLDELLTRSNGRLKLRTR
ncbi:hypothetical protein [Actinophytocola algeriensis]|uniref:Uncharacterized protein n=1 Tax=Actinophytocola algeriensis TaxID=1768010 RepID=A0A7W7VE59_9PSEU|nr:hypothetical protein [Actinophytocola algeriensis]MBB4906660.1 hypothetical protein [Actinophytocola algeriensis]MBE1478141.1 hypothetical protein [Actinophytocola algeriensis]